MYPPSPYAKPRGSFLHPVDPPIEQDAGACPLLTVSFNREWLPYILGALDQLVLQTTWKGTQDEVTSAQQRALYLKTLFGNAQLDPSCVATANPYTECEDDMCCLRWNNGVLEQFSCGAWSAVPGLQSNFPAQPGAGTPQAGPGACQTYDALLNANSTWLLPTLVSTGDTVQFAAATGAGNETTDPTWYCPDGSVFALGACVGGGATKSTDPLNTVNHMRIIAKIGSSYYDVQAGTFTVPGGVSLAQMTFQVNNNILSTNSGSYQFQVTYCNNAAGTFSHTFNFLTGTGLWTPRAVVAGTQGHWVLGSGWVHGDCAEVVNNWYRQVDIERVFAARTITSISVTFNCTAGAFNVGGNTCYAFYDVTHSTVPKVVPFSSMVSGSGQVLLWSGSIAGVADLRIDMACSGDYSTSAPLTGVMTLTALTITGVGSDPF